MNLKFEKQLQHLKSAFEYICVQSMLKLTIILNLKIYFGAECANMYQSDYNQYWIGFLKIKIDTC